MHLLLNLKNDIKKNNNVYSPINDEINYDVVHLDNGLKIFFIQNKDSNSSSACVNVRAGSIHDPKHIEGMAHYLEHMLFMGSVSYPGEGYFINRVAQCGGTTNAFTTDTYTQFFFKVSENFMELLKIFSRFFIEPAFDVKYVEKEVSAVDSEHKKNVGSDGWRIAHLSRKFMIDGVNNKFATGTKKSLLGSCDNNPNILRTELIKFYESYYSSDKMVLFICHKELNGEIIKLIKDMFEEVPKRKTIEIDNTAIVNEINGEYELIKIKTVNDGDSLIIKWYVDTNERYQNNLCVDSLSTISYILGHEGKSSLYYILTGCDLVHDIFVGVDDNYESNCCFMINIDLTTYGSRQWENILYVINCYIRHLIILFHENEHIYDIYSNELDTITKLNTRTSSKVDGLQMASLFMDWYEVKRIDLEYVPITLLYREVFKHNVKITNTY